MAESSTGQSGEKSGVTLPLTQLAWRSDTTHTEPLALPHTLRSRTPVSGSAVTAAQNRPGLTPGPELGLLISTSMPLLVLPQQVKHLNTILSIFQTYRFYLRSLSEVLWRVPYHRPPSCFPHGLHSIQGVLGCRLDPTSMTYNLLASPVALLPSPYSSLMGPKSIPGPGYKMKLRPKYW